MILQANRRTSTTAPLRQASTDGPEEWGHWAGRKSVLERITILYPGYY